MKSFCIIRKSKIYFPAAKERGTPVELSAPQWMEKEWRLRAFCELKIYPDAFNSFNFSTVNKEIIEIPVFYRL
jgi:hypothetical protein